MQILITAATAAEIKWLTGLKNQVEVLVTGVGTPSTLYHLQKSIHQVKYDCIIQAGIAGSFTDDHSLGQVVLVKQDCFADIGFEEKEKFTPLFSTAFADKNTHPFTNGWLMNTGLYPQYANLQAVKGITVNKVSDSKLQKQQYINTFNADIETMEGAALHYICLQEQISFIQIRSISNMVGERDKTKWKMDEAVENLNKELAKLINQLTDLPAGSLTK